jgi:hypothetical protein
MRNRIYVISIALTQSRVMMISFPGDTSSGESLADLVKGVVYASRHTEGAQEIYAVFD